MGNFANTLFSVLLGWVHSAVAWLWQLISADGADGVMGWVLDHWLVLAVGLCVIGLVVDFVVYLIRWQPYRVWRDFLHHGRGEEPEEEHAPQAAAPAPLQWLYANGETATEPPPAPMAPDPAPPPEPVRGVQRVVPARRRRTADGGEYVLPTSPEDQPGYHSPVYPPQWQAGGQEQTHGGMQG